MNMSEHEVVTQDTRPKIEVRIHGVWMWHPLVSIDLDAWTATVELRSGQLRELPITERYYPNGRVQKVENGAYINPSDFLEVRP